MPLFYAYISNEVAAEGTWSLLGVFASRTVADEWWRAVSTSVHARFIKRMAPQLYTYDAIQCNLSGFFDMPQFKPIADKFQGRMFFTQLNDKSELGTTIIPPQEITDHVSGGWYYIRSVSNVTLCWHYDAAENKIRALDGEPTRFRIDTGNSVQKGAIMVGEDEITLHLSAQRRVYLEQSGELEVWTGLPDKFRFSEFENGNFAISEDATVVFVDDADTTLRLRSWQLVPAPSPTQRKMAPESSTRDKAPQDDDTTGHFKSENLDSAGSACIGFEKNSYFFIQEKGTVNFLTPTHWANTEGIQLGLNCHAGHNKSQMFFIDSYGALHHAASGLAIDIIDDVLVLRQRRPVSSDSNPWSHPLPEFSFINSQIRIKFLSNPALPSCADKLYPNNSWITKQFLLATHNEKDFHRHPISDFSEWIPTHIAGDIPYDTSAHHSVDWRVLVEERTRHFGGKRTSWEIVAVS
ncbi:hypothetical protein FIBSPDRAFT_804010 [Athelia psychrophila]|uniref:Uncharacterized protein n=1 Tax=Athelia psychrophila TaxID=1759441 RepID=A0A167XPN4_9AGAM|nr:hypothetical protein FIBSPDRAFT_804010 [Fibularhizoctonia sp. CBS 109695]